MVKSDAVRKEYITALKAADNGNLSVNNNFLKAKIHI